MLQVKGRGAAAAPERLKRERGRKPYGRGGRAGRRRGRARRGRRQRRRGGERGRHNGGGRGPPPRRTGPARSGLGRGPVPARTVPGSIPTWSAQAWARARPLCPAGDGLLARLATACAEAGQAASLTLAHVRHPGEFILPEAPAPVVHIVENPSVLALALRRFGPRCPPLVCTSGWPNSAAIQVLRMLADQGAALRYHGDFDGEGVRIAAYVLDKTPARPWRMTAADYRAAVALNPRGPQPGRITEAPWDLDLAEAMAEHGIAVVEELVAEVLLKDLAGTALQRRRPGWS
ncbi:TIGR02679 family protein [Streptomyces althioticus]|uniref:TIGR02679 family protein n=1 Tax=Streptomyces althioticus TaxID=83380 RepID=UPI0033F9423D